MSGAVVEVEGLRKRYGDVDVVHDVDLEVRRGEVLGILGANGAGKTTTVECVQGLRRPDAGAIRVCGLDPEADRSELARRVGSQLQDSALPDRLRVEEAIRLFAGPRADPLDDVLATWGLTAQRRSAFASLSGGQQQRLFVALALLNHPEVVFLDELTQGLDPNARLEVWGLLERLRARGTTIVLVTHFLDEAEALCDRIMVMRAGRVAITGTPSGLVDELGAATVISFTTPAGLEPTDTFGRLPGLERIEVDGTTVRLLGRRELIAHAGAALVAYGDVPSDIDVDQPKLEQVLLPIMDGRS